MSNVQCNGAHCACSTTSTRSLSAFHHLSPRSLIPPLSLLPLHHRTSYCVIIVCVYSRRHLTLLVMIHP
eukprot:225629-Pyramimonas_sp.AAC.1